MLSVRPLKQEDTFNQDNTDILKVVGVLTVGLGCLIDVIGREGD